MCPAMVLILQVRIKLFQEFLVDLAGFIEKTLRKVELSLIYLFLDLREAIGTRMISSVCLHGQGRPRATVLLTWEAANQQGRWRFTRARSSDQ